MLPSRIECSFSMTLLHGQAAPEGGAAQGRAVQVQAIKPTLKRLELSA